MESELVKGRPLTKEETTFLLELIEGSRIITTKTTNASNNKLKNEEWIRLAQRFNATATNYPRTPQQLRLKWENLKKNSRKRSTKIRMNQIKTGGGPADYIPPDDILDRVTGLLGSTATGFTVPYGGDREVDCGIGGGVGGSGDGERSGDGEFRDARVSLVEVNEGPLVIPLPVDSGIEPTVVTKHNVELDVIDSNSITPNKRLTFSTPRTVKKKKTDDTRSTRNIAIAEYFTAKKQCVDATLNNLNLENDNLKLRNIELKLQNEKLLLETEKLKYELEKLKRQL